MISNMGKKEIYWHLPGFCSHGYLNQIIINLLQRYPEHFYEGYRIGSVYGTFPGAIWNGGRAAFGFSSKRDIEKTIRIYNEKGVPVRFTWTNALLEEKHLNDTYCNLIMQIANNGKNQVLVNRPVLEEYIRKEYPNYPVISSTTKCMTDTTTLIDEIGKDYELVVLDYNLNHDWELLEQLKPRAEKVELLVNEICYPNCKKRQEHYRDESRRQLDFDISCPFECQNKVKPTFEECMKRPAFISNEEISRYQEMGFVNFKIVGRGLPQDLVKESYLYYLVKEESQTLIRDKIETALQQVKKTK